MHHRVLSRTESKQAHRTDQSGDRVGWGAPGQRFEVLDCVSVIILSALQRSPDPSSFGLSETSLFRLWLVAVMVNSGYSFYWDIARDWDLTLLSNRERNNPEHPWGLRRHRWFHAKEIYYAAIVMDAILRCTWSMKLSAHLDHFNDLEGGIFAMQVLEVFRRWMWIFFRVETEWGESSMTCFCLVLTDIVQCVTIVDQPKTIYCWVISRTSTTKANRLHYKIPIDFFRFHTRIRTNSHQAAGNMVHDRTGGTVCQHNIIL
jgi:hypothetical protein